MSSLKIAAVFAAAATATVGGMIGITHLAIGRTGGPPTYRQVTEWGTVTKLENFNARRRSYRADVTTDRLRFDNIDISRFPGEGLAVGDRIALLKQGNAVRQETFYVRNEQMQPIAICMDWMPCWDSSLQNNNP